MKYWNIGMVLILIFGIGWIWMSSLPANDPNRITSAPQEGFLAPGFSLETMDGESISLSDLRGQVILINFWASWCPPCRAEMSTMQKVFEDYREQGFTILAINSTVQDQQSEAIDFVQELGLTFPILFDVTGDVTSIYLIEALPTSFFIDREGIIQDIVIGGPMPEALLQDRIEKLLREGQ